MAYRSSALTIGPAGNITATPAGVVAGDYLCGCLACDSTSATVTVPTGWTKQLTLTLAGPDGQLFVFADAVATGSDAFQWNNSAGNVAVINAAFSGRNTSVPRTALDGQKNETSNATPATVTHTGVTAAQGDDIAVFMMDDSTAADGRWSFSQITNYTERQDDNGATSFVNMALDTQDNVTAGATGSLSSTTTRDAGTGNTGWGIIVVAIAKSGPTTAQILPAYMQEGQSWSVRYV